MRIVYWLSLTAAVSFLVWTHTHTDELPIVLGFVLIVTALMSAVFPREYLGTALIAGGAVFVAETLVHYSVLRAPYPPSAGIPWVALFGYVPAVLGVGIGIAVRRLI